MKDAIDELEALRARVAEVEKERDAAKADAARLREALEDVRERVCEMGAGDESDTPAVAVRLVNQSEDALEAIDDALATTDSAEWLAKHDATRLRAALAEIARPKRGGIEANDSDEEWFEYLRNALERERAIARSALSATDSAEWLAKHDADVLAQEREGRLAAKLTAMDAHCDNEALRAQVDSLTKQLVAATNDAARAELRARDLKETGERLRKWAEQWRTAAGAIGRSSVIAQWNLLAAAPDSDARLREVMLKLSFKTKLAVEAAQARGDVRNLSLDAVVDEVLRSAP